MKKLRMKFGLVLMSLAMLVVVTACNKDDDDQPQPAPMAKTVVEIASGDEQFSILVDALVKADLVSALEGDGPYTVFAPTNAAFNDLFSTLGVSGLDQLSAEQLRPILLYHVLSGEAKSSSLANGYVSTLNTATPDNAAALIYVNIDDQVLLNGSTMVTSADVDATNGVIHVIDKVLLPMNVVDIAISNPDFSILVEAVVKAGLVDALSAEGPFTVFAPTNAAFEALFADLGVSGIADLTAEQLTPILLYHVVADNVRSSEVSAGEVPTLNTESTITVSIMDGKVMLDGNATVIAVDVQGSNGVVHVIDNVILP